MQAAARDAGQGHLFDGWEGLGDDQRQQLLQDVKVSKQALCGLSLAAGMHAFNRWQLSAEVTQQAEQTEYEHSCRVACSTPYSSHAAGYRLHLPVEHIQSQHGGR